MACYRVNFTFTFTLCSKYDQGDEITYNVMIGHDAQMEQKMKACNSGRKTIFNKSRLTGTGNNLMFF